MGGLLVQILFSERGLVGLFRNCCCYGYYTDCACKKYTNSRGFFTKCFFSNQTLLLARRRKNPSLCNKTFNSYKKEQRHSQKSAVTFRKSIQPLFETILPCHQCTAIIAHSIHSCIKKVLEEAWYLWQQHLLKNYNYNESVAVI